MPAARPRSTSSTAASPRKGRELGIATPCNDAVVELVHSMERGERAPEPRWLRLRQRGADDQRDRH